MKLTLGLKKALENSNDAVTFFSGPITRFKDLAAAEQLVRGGGDQEAQRLTTLHVTSSVNVDDGVVTERQVHVLRRLRRQPADGRLLVSLVSTPVLQGLLGDALRVPDHARNLDK